MLKLADGSCLLPGFAYSAGQAALQEASDMQPKEADFLTLFDRMKQHYPSDLGRAALETAILRSFKAFDKFPVCRNGCTSPVKRWSKRPHLQSPATGPSRYRSFTSLVDLGCSIGGDTLALAKIAPTLGASILIRCDWPWPRPTRRF